MSTPDTTAAASAPSLVVSLPGRALRAALGPVPEGVQLIDWDMTGPSPVPHIDIVVQPYMGATPLLANLAGTTTRLVQSQSIGYDGVTDVLPAGHTFANASSVHETSTAELTLAMILASQRGIPDFVRAAAEGRWAPARHASLADRTVLIVGYGGVGQAIEARLAPFEVNVVRVASTARNGATGHIHGIAELSALLPLADVVVVGVPLSDSTHHLVDDAFLAAMPDGALLVNIARGPVADTAALLAHAGSGRLRLALDVTDPEPLPAGHPLFALPNVLITPHVGGASTAMMPRMGRLLADQIERMLQGDAPRNVVVRS
ncbi:2-hydroxyacid dehydrogenase [Microterricola viridarii]|uniref:Hydroxyacid dehydrogenase n=1 Tax=Microterricola viridarii TaxID=412690 RepID=A0A109QXC8_9MICO|nr:2-hydroxyacid dehydrogenase [Microterricola viridarii]AMB59765.1 hydroxyacid dehydrogenase [Microterricola viridarii]